jgi:hypothetical protein
MKKNLFAVVAAFVAINAHAGNVLATMNNQNGGRIELAGIQTPAQVQNSISACKNTFIAKTWGNDGADTFGCWSSQGDTIVIEWLVGPNGVERTYMKSDFTLTPEAQAQYNKNQQTGNWQ